MVLPLVRLVSALLCAAIVAGCQRENAAAPSPADAPVIIISIDTLRADRLPAYGYEKIETPHIDALRRDGILFRNAYAHVPLTLPSHASILTGLLPTTHGVRNNLGYTLDASRHRTLPALLKERGYATGAAVSAFVLRASTGIADGFDFFDDAIPARGGGAAGNLSRPGAVTLDAARKWLAGRGGKPLFFMFHIFEPHAPYEPVEPFKSRYADAYDGEVAAADDLVGQFVAALKEEGIYDRAIVILLADHGEGLNQHGEPEHGIFLYREVIQVPLIVKLPAAQRAGETVERPVGLADVTPTVASLVGIDGVQFDGRSLLDDVVEPAPVYAESYYGRIHLGWSELRSLVDERFHFIEAPRPELYDVRNDPGETVNVIERERRQYARLRSRLAEMEKEFAAPASISEEDAGKLAALGYLGSTRAAPAGPLPDPKDRIHELGAIVEAQRLAAEGRTTDAVAALEKLLSESPGSTDARIQLAQLLEADGRLEDAAGHYKKVLTAAPELAGEVGGTMGSLLLKLGRHEEAVAHARLAEKSNRPGMHLLLAQIELARGNLPRAAQEAQAAAAFGTARHDARLLLAQVLVRQGEFEKALRQLDELDAEITRDESPPLRGLHLTRGDALAHLERAGEAIAAFEREIALFPLSRDAYARLALVHLLLNDRPGAHAVLEKMVRRSPTRESHLFAARTLEDLDDPAGAAVWRRRAAAIR